MGNTAIWNMTFAGNTVTAWIVALSIMLDAACTHSVRRDAAAIPGVGASDLEDLGRWVAACERRFITPLKVELLRFDFETCRRITEVLW